MDFSGRVGLCGVNSPDVSGSSNPRLITNSAMGEHMGHKCSDRNGNHYVRAVAVQEGKQLGDC